MSRPSDGFGGDAPAMATLVGPVAAVPAVTSLGHGPAQAPPVPHWAVLLVAVPALWLAIGGLVVGLDRILTEIGW